MADDSRKLFYSIGEVAAIFQVNESTLRFWEKEFPTVIKPRKNAKGTRTYTKDDIENIRLIHFLLKEKGMTLAGARKKLREEKKGMTAQHELTDRLKKIKSELLKLQTELGQPAQEAPEFVEEAPMPNRMVFAEPGSAMISVEAITEELPTMELTMEEVVVPEMETMVEQAPSPEPEAVLEESPFDFSDVEATAEVSYELEVEEPELQAEVVEKLDELVAEDLEEMAELEAEVRIEPIIAPEPEETPEQNLFYEQPESVEPPKPSNDGWSGSLF